MAKKSSNYGAAKSRVARFETWSFSRYMDHSGPDGCPYRAKLRHLDKKDKAPPGPALVRGAEVHATGARWLAGTLKKLPQEYAAFKSEMTWLKKHLECQEQDWGITRDWKPTGFFDADTWGRLKLDALTKAIKKVMKAVDFKTGKYKERNLVEYETQLELYGVVTLIKYPAVESVEAELWYLDEGLIHGGAEDGMVYHRDDLPRLIERWEERLRPMLEDRKFAPRPSGGCTWCPFSAVKGGPCKY